MLFRCPLVSAFTLVFRAEADWTHDCSQCVANGDCDAAFGWPATNGGWCGPGTDADHCCLSNTMDCHGCAPLGCEAACRSAGHGFSTGKCAQDGSVDPAKCCECFTGPSPTPSPSPSPAPSPAPSPSPGHLPDIPDVDIWVGFWGARKAMYDDASLAFDYSGPAYKTSQIEKHGGGGLRFLYPAFMFFCEEEEMTNTCTLKDDYEDQWNDAVPEMTQLLKDGKIIGFTVGDERVCSDGGHGTSVKHLTKMIDTIRESFPDRKKAIIHYNECGSTFGHYKDGKCKDAAMTDVPSGLDWISIDHYRGSKEKDGFMDDLKGYHKDCIYPKMHSQQRICITTGTTSEVCPNEKTCLEDAKYAVDWAESDGKVACITPYRWDDMDDLDDGKWSDLKDYWRKYARKSRPGMQNATVV